MKKTQSAVLIWDLPTRVFHWTLVICVIGAIISIKIGKAYLLEWHPRFGIMTLSLIIFRIIWGFIGPFYARFSQFLVSPKKIFRYIKNKGNLLYAGHNPLGGLSILLILLILGAQGISGLFISDDIFIQGFFYSFVKESTASFFLSFHRINKWFIFNMILIHLLAVFFYSFVKNRKIITPMITGYFLENQVLSDTIPTRDDWKVRCCALIIFLVLTFFLVSYML